MAIHLLPEDCERSWPVEYGTYKGAEYAETQKSADSVANIPNIFRGVEIWIKWRIPKACKAINLTNATIQKKVIIVKVDNRCKMVGKRRRRCSIQYHRRRPKSFHDLECHCINIARKTLNKRPCMPAVLTLAHVVIMQNIGIVYIARHVLVSRCATPSAAALAQEHRESTRLLNCGVCLYKCLMALDTSLNWI